jgi:hypothetical protein
VSIYFLKIKILEYFEKIFWKKFLHKKFYSFIFIFEDFNNSTINMITCPSCQGTMVHINLLLDFCDYGTLGSNLRGKKKHYSTKKYFSKNGKKSPPKIHSLLGYTRGTN